VSVFVRLHPLLDADAVDLPGISVLHGETVAVDLTRPESQQWRETRKSHRQQIRRAERLGYRASVDDDLRHLDAFSRLYRATMDRRHAESYYHFDDAYFRGLADVLRHRLILCVVESGGVLCAAGIFVETEGIVESHLSADDPARSKGGVKKLMYDHVRRWAMARGDRWLHLGGGVGGQADSLLHFKAGFSPLRRPFRSLRAITRAADYRRLVHEAGLSPDAHDPSAYFPAYRHP
jgi:lipid II:glycine glycyltransferase (peptidoglycan interpeptide bridge formation enzyme)